MQLGDRRFTLHAIVGNGEALWMNGIYDSVCAILIFPMLVYLGASGKQPISIPPVSVNSWGISLILCIWYIIHLYTCILGG